MMDSNNNYELLNYSRWNRRLINLYWICTAVVLVIEIIIAVYYYNWADSTVMTIPLSDYVRDIIILPCVIMVILIAACKIAVFLVQKNHSHIQPYIITFTCVALSTVLVIIHYGINVIFVTCVIPIIFSLAYDNKKVLLYTFIFSFVCFIGAFLYLNYYNLSIKFDFAECVTNIAILFVVYLICRTILNRYKEIVGIMIETAKHNLDLLDKVHYDELTQIYNRRYMEETLRYIIKSTARSGSLLSLMMVDVDFFKKYNDTYGHSMGDKCLKSIAKTLADSLDRADDFTARYGGEEFVVVLPNTDEKGAHIIAKRLLENVTACNIPHKKNEVADFITVSVGVTTGTVKYTHSVEDYIKRADKALYISKQSGRNRYTFLEFEESE